MYNLPSFRKEQLSHCLDASHDLTPSSSLHTYVTELRNSQKIFCLLKITFRSRVCALEITKHDSIHCVQQWFQHHIGNNSGTFWIYISVPLWIFMQPFTLKMCSFPYQWVIMSIFWFSWLVGLEGPNQNWGNFAKDEINLSREATL